MRRKLLALFMGLVAAALAAEVGLRATWDGYYLKTTSQHVPDELLGWVNAPSHSSEEGTHEFRYRRVHNSLGMRGGELGEEGARARLLVVGDSFVYGHGVDNDETFCALLEAELEGVDVLNAGVVGYNTVQERIALERWLPVVRPDAVLLVFFWNDFSGNLLAGEVDGEGVRCVFDYEGLMERYEEKNAPQNGIERVLARSYAARFVSEIGGKRRKLERTERERARVEMEAEEVETAWEITRRGLEEVREVLEAKRIPWAIVWAPSQLEIDPEALGFPLPVFYEDVRERLEVFAAGGGLRFLDAGPAFAEDFGRDGEPLFFLLDRHFSPKGNVVMARALEGLARELIEEASGP